MPLSRNILVLFHDGIIQCDHCAESIASGRNDPEGNPLPPADGRWRWPGCDPGRESARRVGSIRRVSRWIKTLLRPEAGLLTIMLPEERRAEIDLLEDLLDHVAGADVVPVAAGHEGFVSPAVPFEELRQRAGGGLQEKGEIRHIAMADRLFIR